MTALRYAAAAVLVVALAGCGDDAPDVAPTPEPTADGTPTGDPSRTPTPSGTGSETGSGASTAPELTWEPVPGPVDDAVTRNADWTLTVTDDGRGWSLDGPEASTGGRASGWRVSDALMDEHWAVVVEQERTESQPSRAHVTDLRTGDTFTIDGTAQVPTTTGGTWALGDDRLLHATYGPGRAYCVAAVDLATRESRLSWCAPKRTGFNGAQLTPAGTSVLSFTGGGVSCRTLMAVEGSSATPFEGVEECAAWDGLLIEDGQVWSVIPNERRVEQAHFYATVGDERADLGPGVAGSLTWCGDAAWFTRDPQAEGEPAALLRWSPADGLSTAYESPGGRAFLSEPRCGGDHLTVTALAEAGDEQVTARVR